MGVSIGEAPLSRSRVLAVLTAAVVLAAVGLLGQPATGSVPHVAKDRTAVTCGTWRWAVKTLSDGKKKQVNYHPLSRGVSFLRHIMGPGGLGSGTPRLADSPEMHVYHVKVMLLKAVTEPDRDIHLVVAQPGHPFQTLIAEFPNTACKGAAGSFKRSRIAAARAALLHDCGSISSSEFTKLKGSATLTGVGFYDEMHGQTGIAPNGIELHPVLSYSGSCSKPSTGGGGGGGGGGNCSPAYPDFCIPPPPPDLDCADVAPHTNFTVRPPDPHGFDGDGDGVGCES
jgi:hypothetical protein